MMERPEKQRPMVMITTYASGGCRFADKRSSNQQYSQQNSNHQQEGQHYQQEQQVDKSEWSTDLFSEFGCAQIKSNKSGLSRTRAKLCLELNQIRGGPSGSVRGHRDVVKKSLENICVGGRNFAISSLPTFISANSNNQQNSLDSHSSTLGETSISQQLSKLYRSDYLNRLVCEERNLCVAYTTTLGIIRRTYEDSKLMKSILNLNLIKFDDRDIYLNQEYKNQLKIRQTTTGDSVGIPALYVDGKFMGGIKELETMNESGKLAQILAKFKVNTSCRKMSKLPREICQCCGNARFIACPSCNGSRKSTIHHFKFNSVVLRCIKCDQNDGLVQCSVCCFNESDLVQASNLDENSNIVEPEKGEDINNNNNNHHHHHHHDKEQIVSRF